METLRIVGEIVEAQASHARMTPDDMTEAIKKVYRAVRWIQAQEEKSAKGSEEAAISPTDSIQRYKVVCLECGQEFRQLTGRHLALHGLDPKSYKRRYEIPLRQSLSCRSLSAKRRRAAKERGLGEILKKARKARK